MAQSTCIKCGSPRFEIRENLLTKPGVKVRFVQCARCGTPIGVLDDDASGSALKASARSLQEMEDYFKQNDPLLTNIRRIAIR